MQHTCTFIILHVNVHVCCVPQALSMAGEDGSQMRCTSKFTLDMLSGEAHSPPLPGALHVPVALDAQPLLGGAAAQSFACS